MTFGELQQDVYDDSGGNNPAPAPGTVARIAKNLNKAQRKILSDSALIRLRRTGTPLTLTSEANRFLYGLPASLSSVLSMTERSTNRILYPKTVQEIREEDPGFSHTDTPWAVIPIGYKPVQNQPSSTGLWVVSSSASDTDQTAEVDGGRASNAISTDVTATLNGTTRVAMGTLTDYVDVLSFTISSTALGTVSLYDAAASGNLLAEIPIGQTTPQYFMVQIYPTPAAAVTYYVDGIYRILTMRHEQDVPQVPEEFHDLLSCYAKEKEAVKAGEGQRAAYYRVEFDEGMQVLRHTVSAQGVEVPVVSRRTSPRVSRYGANCPVGPF